MPELHYPKPYVFTDARRNKEYTGPGTFDVPEDAVDQYINRGWQRPDADEDESEVVVEDEDTAEAETVYDAEAKPAEAGNESTASSTPAPDDEPEGVDEQPPSEQSDDDGEPVSAEEPEPDQVEYDDLTVSELEEVLDDRAAEFSNERLRKLIDHEKSNKNRKSALKALRSHLDDEDADADEDAGSEAEE